MYISSRPNCMAEIIIIQQFLIISILLFICAPHCFGDEDIDYFVSLNFFPSDVVQIGENVTIDCSTQPNIDLMNATIRFILNSSSEVKVPIEIISNSTNFIARYSIEGVNASHNGTYTCSVYKKSGHDLNIWRYAKLVVGSKPIAPNIDCNLFDNKTARCCLNQSKEEIRQNTSLTFLSSSTLKKSDNFTFDFFFVSNGNRLVSNKNESKCKIVNRWADSSFLEANVNVSNALGSDQRKFRQEVEKIKKPTLIKMLTCPDKNFVGVYLEMFTPEYYKQDFNCINVYPWKSNNQTLYFTKKENSSQEMDISLANKIIDCNFIFGEAINHQFNVSSTKTKIDQRGEIPYRQIVMFREKVMFGYILYWNNLKPYHNFTCQLSLSYENNRGLPNNLIPTFQFQLQEDAPSMAPKILPIIFKTKSTYKYTFYFTKVDQFHLNGELSHYEYKCSDDDNWKMKTEIETIGPFVTCNKSTSDSFTFHLQVCTKAGCTANSLQVQQFSTKSNCSIPDFRLVKLKGEDEYELLTMEPTNETIFFICYKNVFGRSSEHDCTNVQEVRINSHRNAILFTAATEMSFAMTSLNNECKGISIETWPQWKSNIFQISANQTKEHGIKFDVTDPQRWSLSRQIKVTVTLPTSHLLVQSISLSINCTSNDVYSDIRSWENEKRFLPVGNSFLLESIAFYDMGPCLVNLSYKSYGDPNERVLRTNTIINHDSIYIGLLISFAIIVSFIISVIARYVWKSNLWKTQQTLSEYSSVIIDPYPEVEEPPEIKSNKEVPIVVPSQENSSISSEGNNNESSDSVDYVDAPNTTNNFKNEQIGAVTDSTVHSRRS